MKEHRKENTILLHPFAFAFTFDIICIGLGSFSSERAIEAIAKDFFLYELQGKEIDCLSFALSPSFLILPPLVFASGIAIAI